VSIAETFSGRLQHHPEIALKSRTSRGIAAACMPKGDSRAPQPPQIAGRFHRLDKPLGDGGAGFGTAQQTFDFAAGRQLRRNHQKPM
jgi:hypothetical protein